MNALIFDGKSKSTKANKMKIFRIIITLLLLMLAFDILYFYRFNNGAENIPPKFETVIHESDTADQELIDKGVAELNRYFDGVDAELDPFLDDLFTWKTKSQMLWYMMKDLKWDIPDNIPPSTMALILVPHREGNTLEEFLGNKFNTFFGGSEKLEEELEITIGAIGLELQRNNSQLEMQLGELLAEDINALKHEGKSAIQCMQEIKSGISDLSGRLVGETAGVQIGVELTGVATDFWVAPVIGGFLAEIAGLAEGLATSLATWGTGIIIAVAIDIVANKVARDNLKPEIQGILTQWRQETIKVFREKMTEKLAYMHSIRNQAIAEILNNYKNDHNLVADM